MDQFEHDSAASMEVRFCRAQSNRMGPGWYVVRTCPCHARQQITVPFASKELAERALRVLDADARRYAIRV